VVAKHNSNVENEEESDHDDADDAAPQRKADVYNEVEAGMSVCAALNATVLASINPSTCPVVVNLRTHTRQATSRRLRRRRVSSDVQVCGPGSCVRSAS
jgi:hypothetical protein